MKVTDHTIICDNSICKYEKKIKVKDIPTYIGKPCPNCGENLLTDKDFDDFLTLLEILKNIPTSENTDSKILLNVKGGKLYQIKL